MKYAIYGSGAIGSVLAARLIEAGEDVSVIARGPHLAAMLKNGVQVKSKLFGAMLVHPPASDDPAGQAAGQRPGQPDQRADTSDAGRVAGD